MIKSFKCKEIQKLFETGRALEFAPFARLATRKLTQLEAAATLEFLRSPPGNQLAAPVDDRNGRHSIRVNDQFRLCFKWTELGPEDVEITKQPVDR